MAVAAALVALWPGTASAHASLLAADPAPGSVLSTLPALVTLHFSEPVTPIGSGITLISPAGRPVPTGAARPAGADLQAVVGGDGERGTYLLIWKVVAGDTHPSRGRLLFSVGEASAPPAGESDSGDVGAVSPAGLLIQTAARWIHFAGFALAFGPLLSGLLLRQAARPLLTGLGIGLLVGAEPVALLGQLASLGTFDTQAVGDVLASPFGRVFGLRLGSVLALWSVLGATARSGRSRWAPVALGGVLALVDGAASHRLAGLPVSVGIVLNGVHEAAMGAWLGGLAAHLTLPARARGAGFSRLAGWSFATAAASGALLALTHLRSPLDLALSGYGAVLAVKMVAVAAVAVLAWLAGRRRELVALFGLLGIAALLLSLPPPR